MSPKEVEDFRLRLKPETKKKLYALAKKAGMSVNSYLCNMIDSYCGTGFATNERVNEIEKRVQDLEKQQSK